MTLLDINNIIDIEYIDNNESIKTNSDDNDLDEDNSNVFILNKETNRIENQIEKNLKQLETIIEIIRKKVVNNDLFQFELNRIDSLYERLDNINDLYDFYKESIVNLNNKNVIKFLQIQLIKRLNDLNTVFNLNHNFNIQILNDSDSVSILNLNQQECDLKLLDKNKRKFRINSIDLDDDDCDDEDQDLMCAIYQFDDSNVIKQHLNVQPTRLTKPKRSTSADNYSSTLKRKQRQARIQNSELFQFETLPNDKEENTSKLNANVIHLNSFKFKYNKSNQLNECFDLKSNCTQIKIIVYKLIKFYTKTSCNQYKNPVKYVSINLASHTYSNTQFETFKLELKSFNKNKRLLNSRRSSNKKETASSMLKRMFVKSKVPVKPNSNNNNIIDGSDKNLTLGSLKNETFNQCYINFDISRSESEQFILNSELVDIRQLESWLNLWQNDLCIKQINENYESLTIYLNKIESCLDVSEEFHFIQIRIETKSQSDETITNSMNLFRSNLFKLNDDINDLCQIPIDETDLNICEKILKFDLFKLDARNESIKMVSSSSVSLFNNRHNLTQLNELNLGNSMKISNLKIKFLFQSNYYPTRRIAIDLLEFNLDSSNANCLLNLIDIYLISKNNSEPILIRKFLEFFSILNDSNKFSVKTNEKRLIRDLLLEKLYLGFLQLIHVYYIVEKKNEIDLKFIVSNLKNEKLTIQFLISHIRNNFEKSALFELTVKCLSKLIEIIIYLSINKSKYEIKYEINDLIMKIFRMECLDTNQQTIVYNNLDLSFILLLTDFYTPYELADMIINKVLNKTNELLSLKLVNSNIFQLDFFKSNYQFRNRFVQFFVKNFLDKSFKLTHDHLKLIKNVLIFKKEISKQNIDDLIRSLFKQLINLVINVFKTTDLLDKQIHFKKDSIIIDSFLSLFEIINIITNIKTFSINDILSNQDLNYLFEIIIFYIKNSNKIINDIRCQAKMNIIILRFSKFIQKHLQFYQIAENIEINDESALIQSYFEMLFSFVNNSNTSFSLTIRFKFKMIKIIQTFWSSLSAKLKYSIYLNEFLINQLCKCLISNFYFKLDEFKPTSSKPISCTQHIYLSHFISTKNLTTESYVFKFYEQCIKMLNDIFVSNSACGLFNLENMNEFILFSIMNWILSKENNIDSRLSLCSNSSSNSSCESTSSSSSSSASDFDFDINNSCAHFTKKSEKSIRNFSHQIFDLIEVNFSKLNSDQIKSSILGSMSIGVDYNLIKDEYTTNSQISIIENLLVTYNLIKMIDDLNLKSNNKLFTSQAYLNENRRQIKMYLLDDIYSLFKIDKNYQLMSLVRKQQTDLIEWNLNRKNESDLKEIFYLKLLKKFAINSLNETILPAAVAIPSISSSSVMASSFSSSSSSSSLGVQSATNTISSSDINDYNYQLEDKIQFEICKQIGAYYEKIDENYSKFNRILNAESKFPTNQSKQDDSVANKINSNIHGNLYFRIGIFGSSFKSRSIKNKYFLYKHHSYEMLSNIQNFIINKLSNLNESDIILLHHNQEPDSSIKENKENKCYLQLCAVNRLEKNKLYELIDEMIENKETIETKTKLTEEKFSDNDFFYYFDRPFYMRSSPNANSKKSNSIF